MIIMKTEHFGYIIVTDLKKLFYKKCNKISLNYFRVWEYYSVLIHNFRYGGLSFGETNSIAVLNATQLMSVIDRLARAANNGSDVFPKNNTFFTDLENTTRNFIKQDVAKVWVILLLQNVGLLCF